MIDFEYLCGVLVGVILGLAAFWLIKDLSYNGKFYVPYTFQDKNGNRGWGGIDITAPSPLNNKTMDEIRDIIKKEANAEKVIIINIIEIKNN